MKPRLSRCCLTVLCAAIAALTVTASAAYAQGETCATATVLACGNVNLPTNTVNAVNDYDQAAACTGFDSAGPDVVFKIVLASGAGLDLTFDGPYDASIYLITDCNDPAGSCVS